jgi:hypothetical protein
MYLILKRLLSPFLKSCPHCQQLPSLMLKCPSNHHAKAPNVPYLQGRKTGIKGDTTVLQVTRHAPTDGPRNAVKPTTPWGTNQVNVIDLFFFFFFKVRAIEY